MDKLEYRKNKVNGSRFYLYNQNRINAIKEKNKPAEQKELEEEEENILEELIDEIKTIKRKQTLEKFIKQNKELINELKPEQQTKLLKFIKERFY